MKAPKYFTAEHNDSGSVGDLLKALQQLEQPTVAVGHFEESGVHSISKVPYSVMANWFEHGTRNHDTGRFHIRPFRALVALKMAAKGRTNKALQMAVDKHVKGFLRKKTGMSLNKLMESIGAEYLEELRSIYGNPSRIRSNKASTIARKRSGNFADTPLVDTKEFSNKAGYKSSISKHIKHT